MGDVARSSVAPGVDLVKLNRPKRLNALTIDLANELCDVLREIDEDRSVSAVVLTGEGRGFCTGSDLTVMRAMRETGTLPYEFGPKSVQASYVSCILSLHELGKPVIAAVNGPALGGGFALALAADMRVLSTAATLSSLFIRRGVSSLDMGTSWFLPRLVGPGRAAELMYTGREIGALEAERIGLAERVCEPSDLLEAAIDLASAVAANDDTAVWLTKRGLRLGGEMSLRATLELENRSQSVASRTPGRAEALTSWFHDRENAAELGSEQ